MNPLQSEIEECNPSNSIHWETFDVPPRDTLILMVMLQVAVAILVMIRFDWFPLPGIDWTDPNAVPLKLGLAVIVPVVLFGPVRPELSLLVVAGFGLGMSRDTINTLLAFAIITLFFISLASYLHSLARKWSEMDAIEKVMLPILTVVAVSEGYIVCKHGIILLLVLFDVTFGPQFG